MNFLVKSAPVVALAVLAACASPSPAAVLLTLPPTLAPLAPILPIAAPAVTTTAPSAAPTVAGVLAVRRVNIPEYLVARRVRYRADAATLAEWSNAYWAERIEIGVSREFTSALGQQLPGWMLCDANCGEQLHSMTLQVTLVPMDFLRGAQTLQARARITLSSGGVPAKVLATKDIALDIPAAADTAQAHAQTISTSIGKVAAEAEPMVRSARP